MPLRFVSKEIMEKINRLGEIEDKYYEFEKYCQRELSIMEDIHAHELLKETHRLQHDIEMQQLKIEKLKEENEFLSKFKSNEDKLIDKIAKLEEKNAVLEKELECRKDQYTVYTSDYRTLLEKYQELSEKVADKVGVASLNIENANG